MPKSRAPYPAEFRQQIVALAEAGHTPQKARQAVFRYIEGWYNTQRRHSAIDYESPINYERMHAHIVYPESPSLSTKAG